MPIIRRTLTLRPRIKILVTYRECFFVCFSTVHTEKLQAYVVGRQGLQYLSQLNVSLHTELGKTHQDVVAIRSLFKSVHFLLLVNSRGGDYFERCNVKLLSTSLIFIQDFFSEELHNFTFLEYAVH